MQLAQRGGPATPVGLSLGRFALHAYRPKPGKEWMDRVVSEGRQLDALELLAPSVHDANKRVPTAFIKLTNL
jgi:hypothetical protein